MIYDQYEERTVAQIIVNEVCPLSPGLHPKIDPALDFSLEVLPPTGPTYPLRWTSKSARKNPAGVRVSFRRFEGVPGTRGVNSQIPKKTY